MTKQTILIRSTLASLVSGLFLVPAVHAAGIEILENQDFSVHMVPATEAVAPGAKAKKPPAPAPVQKMRITADGVVPESGDDAAVAANATPENKQTTSEPATVAAKTAPAAPNNAASPASEPVKPAATRNVAATNSNADNTSTKPAASAQPAAPATVTAVKEVANTDTTKDVSAVPGKSESESTDSAKTAAPAPKSVAQHATDSAVKAPAANSEEKTTAEVKETAATTTPVAVETAAPSESGKAELADGVKMRITATGIIPENEYELQLPKEKVNLAEVDATEDAKDEDIARKARKALSGTSKPYMVNGIRYKPMATEETAEFSQVGIASWYGPGFHGRKTANGEVFNQNAMTAAHKRLPISSYVRVTRVSTGKSIVVRINDRGPFVGNRVIDLSYGAAKRLGIVSRGSDKVKIEPISKEAAASERTTETQAKAKKML